jgi:hypothetical protein
MCFAPSEEGDAFETLSRHCLQGQNHRGLTQAKSATRPEKAAFFAYTLPRTAFIWSRMQA